MEARFAFLHGFTGIPSSFDALDLASDVRPVLCGHGPDPDLSSQNYDQEVERVARIIGSEPVHLVGYSMGARIALGLALEYPSLVTRLSLVGVNPGLRSEVERSERITWESRWQDVLDLDGLAVFEHKWRNMPLFSSQGSLPPGTQEEQRRMRLSHTARGLSHAISVLGLGSMPNLWPRLEELRIETRVIVGGLDDKFLAIAQEMEQISTKIRHFSLERVGHNPLLEAPLALRAQLLSVRS